MKLRFKRFVVHGWIMVSCALGMLVVGPFDRAEALTVSPVRLEMEGAPGETVMGSFLLMNEQEETMTFYVSYANFEAQGESGVPYFLEATEDLGTWIRLIPSEINSVTLEPGQTQEVAYEIVIPEDAEPGGHFGAIFWGSSPDPEAGEEESLTVGAKVGILVFLTVEGEILNEGGLIEFGTLDSATWFNNLPVKFFYRFQNEGTDRLVPTGTLTLKNLWGGTKTMIELNAAQSNVLPQSIRRFEEMWGDDLPEETLSWMETIRYQWDHFAMGRYTAELNLIYGEEEEVAVSEVSFWVVPWQLMGALGGGILVGLILLWGLIRRYNRWIIRQALAAQKASTQSKAKSSLTRKKSKGKKKK